MFVAKRFIVPISLTLLVIGFAALLAVVATTVRLGERANEYFDEVISIRDARTAAVGVRSALQSAESAQRGLLLTGNEIYLSPYDAAKAAANRQLETLKHAVGEDLRFKAVLQRLGALVAEKIEEMDRTIALKTDRKDDEAFAIINTNRGKALMDEVNLFASGVVRSLDNRLTTGVAEQRTNARNLRWTSIFAAVLIVLVIAGVSAIMISYTRELIEAQAKIAAANHTLEERVRNRTAALQRANEDIQQFAHLLSHDMRAPLVSIFGFATELQDSVVELGNVVDRNISGFGPADNQAVNGLIKQDMPEAINYIRKSGEKLDKLLNAVLQLSREGRRGLTANVVDLGEVLSSCAAAIRHQLSADGGELNLDLQVPSIVTDQLSLEQVIGNLFDNAAKYRSPERALLVKVRVIDLPDEQIAIEVSDNGRGIAPRDLDRVFELFRRVGKLDQKGDGVGLAYVKAIVGNLGGSIGVSSEVDVGTTFRVTLPQRAIFQTYASKTT
jgi:signal transduction histidine kinase